MRLLFFLLFFSLLSSVQIRIGEEILNIEIADNRDAWAKGLMGRKELPEGKGMLFIYPKPQVLSFWMKNTLIPLSVAFFDQNKICLNIWDMDPPQGKPLISYRSQGPALYALEVPQGWFKKHGIGPGAKFSFLDASLQVK